MRITGNIADEEAEACCKAVDDAADELCLRARVCIEGGLDVDELVGVVAGESTPQVFPRDYFYERHPFAELAAEALAEPHPGQLPIVLLHDHLLALVWVWIHEPRCNGILS
jgi:hypothetical protein